MLFFLNTKVKKNALIIEHAVKAMKEKGVHLETSNFECKPLIGNFLKKYLAYFMYICTLKVLLNMLIGSTNIRIVFAFPLYILY